MAVFEALAPGEVAPSLGVALQLGEAARLPSGIVDVLFKEAGKPFVVAVINRDADLSDGPCDDGVLVDLHVEPAPAVFLDLFVNCAADTEKSQLVQHQAVPQGATKKVVGIGEPVPVAVVALHGARQGIAKGIIDEFVRIQKEDPKLCWRLVEQEPVAPLWVAAVPGKIDNAGPEILCDLPRPVRRAAVDHDDLGETFQAFQTTGEVCFLVFDGDCDGDRQDGARKRMAFEGRWPVGGVLRDCVIRRLKG